MTKDKLIEQPTAAPTRKVKYGAAVGGFVAVAMPFIMPMVEVAWPGAGACIDGAYAAVQPLIAIVAGTFASYMVKERDDPRVSGT